MGCYRNSAVSVADPPCLEVYRQRDATEELVVVHQPCLEVYRQGDATEDMVGHGPFIHSY